MLTGIYGYIFGAEDSNDSTLSSSSTSESDDDLSTVKGKVCEDDWFLIEDENTSSQFSPVLIPHPELRDIDELSFASTHKTVTLPSTEELRRAEELRQAKARTAQRTHLEKMLFEDMSMSTLASVTFKKSSSTKSLKKTGGGQDSLKGKSRSKKSSGKLNSGRNNDRKVNNID